MTNEEAIFELGYAKDFQTPKRKEAIDMAIEALENNDKLAEDLQNCLEMYKKKKAEVEALKQPQIIRCKDCKYHMGEGCCDYWDEGRMFLDISDSDYCSKAERREGE